MKSITRGGDGKFRWRYEMSLFKNLSIYFLIWKIFFFIIMGMFLIMMIADINQVYGTLAERWRNDVIMLGYFLIGMTVITALGYIIYAALMGGKYIVDFEMDENGVWHRQAPAQAKKAKKIGAITAVAGALSGRASMVGTGINSTQTEKYSDFKKVKNVKAYPNRHIIKVNAPFNKNQVYVCSEDFDFVLDYIKMHTN